jgi:hypothetical protein
MQAESISGGSPLAILTQSPALLRQMLYTQLGEKAALLEARMRILSEPWEQQRPRKDDVRHVQVLVDDLRECVSMLEQIGWKAA